MMGISNSKTSNTTMVDRLAHNIKNIEIEAAMRAVDRGMYYEFEEGDVVDPYDDDPWRRGNLHLSAPCIYARALDALDLKPGLSFLNLGSGTGYLNTIVGLLIGPNGSNHGIEFHRDVLEFAEKKLQLFIENSHALDKFDFIEPKFVLGNCLNLDPNSHYDRVYLGAACTPEMEEFMKRLLNIDGILIMPFGNHLRRYFRVSDDNWHHETMMDVNFTQMILERPDKIIIQMPKSTPKSLKMLCRTQIRQHLRNLLDLKYPEIRNKDCYKNRELEIQAGRDCYYHAGNLHFNPDNHRPDYLAASEIPPEAKPYKVPNCLMKTSRPSARAKKLAAAMTLARCRRFRTCMLEMFNTTDNQNNNDNNNNNQQDPRQQSMLKYVTGSGARRGQQQQDQAANQSSPEHMMLATTSSGASSTKDSVSNANVAEISSGDNEESMNDQEEEEEEEVNKKNIESGRANKKLISHNRTNNNSGIEKNGDNTDANDDHDNLAANNEMSSINNNQGSSSSSLSTAAAATYNDDRNNLLRAMRDIKARIAAARRDVRRHSGDDLELEQNDLDVEPCPPHYRSFCESLCERHFREKFLPRLQVHKQLSDPDLNVHDSNDNNSGSSQQTTAKDEHQQQQQRINKLKRKRRNRSPLDSSCSEMEHDDGGDDQDVVMSDTNNCNVNRADTPGNHHHQKRLPISREDNNSETGPTSSSASIAKQEQSLNEATAKVSYNSNNDRDSIAPYLLNCGLNKEDQRNDGASNLSVASNNRAQDVDKIEMNIGIRNDQVNEHDRDEVGHDYVRVELADDYVDDHENDDEDDEQDISSSSESSSISSISDLWTADDDDDDDDDDDYDDNDDLNDMFSPPNSPPRGRLQLNNPVGFAYSPLGFYLGLRNRQLRTRFNHRSINLADREERMRTHYPDSPKYGWRHSYLNRPECELYHQHMEKLIKTLPVPETVKLFLNLDRDYKSSSAT